MRGFVLLLFLIGIISFGNAQDALIADNAVTKCYQTINGEVRDRNTDELMPNSIISLMDTEGNPIETQMALENAIFSFKVDCGRAYKLTASKEDYTEESKNFTTSNDFGIVLKTKIFLDKGSIDFIAATKPVEVKSDDIEITDELKIEDVTIKPIESIEKDPLLEKEGPAADNIEQTVTVSEENKSEVKTIKNNEGNDVLVIKPVLFEYESSYLTKDAKTDLKKVVRIMKQNPNMILECASYTDAKGTNEYNMWMSERRAKRTVDYIVARGIPRSRISGKGYGETKLLNHCTDDVDCTDEERALNRRTEFIVIKQ